MLHWKTLSVALFACAPLCALAWGNHSVAAYRALETMPEVAQASPVVVETLEAFIKAEELPIEALLESQDAWARSNLNAYPRRPAALAFKANAKRTDGERRQAFLQALRVAGDSRFAPYLQPDPADPTELGPPLAYTAVHTLPEPANTVLRFVSIKSGQTVTVRNVVATAAQEPDLGLDINLWDDSPSAWGPTYGFGKLPFGNPAVNFSTQAPFHMGFFHEDPVVYLAAPFLKRTFPVLRTHQYATLAALAFRTGHPYWGWRFAGLALHYVQDLTQPYHATLAPGHSTLGLLATNFLAMVGSTKAKQELIVLLSNRHLALEKYQAETLWAASTANQSDHPMLRALRDSAEDARYPAWSDLYVRDVVAAQARVQADALDAIVVAAMPSQYVLDPTYDFGEHEANITLRETLQKADPAKTRPLDSSLAELLGHFGAHSRNAIRGILKAGGMPTMQNQGRP
jgi:hypothetical protein